MIDILLVDDSPADVELTKEAFGEAKVQNRVSVVYDGVDAMKYLRMQSPFESVTRPDLILLDLNMPRKDGREVLGEIKMDEALKHIPVIILTTSKSDEDIMGSYKQYANCYISKPLDFYSFEEVVKNIENFWFSIVKLPTK